MRTIVHVDLDAFFAAVEALRRPEYRGKPLVVGGDPNGGRGVVATCSYEARAYGIRSAMPIREAKRRCPHAIFVRPDMKTYAKYSGLFHELLSSLSPRVEPLSVDEAFVDMTGCEHFYSSPHAMAATIKRRIEEACHLTASVGVAPNKLLAKLASDSQKPDGLVVIEAAKAQAFLDPLPIERLWGIGPKTAEHLRMLGINHVRDARARTPQWLAAHIGRRAAAHLHRLSQGIDERLVEPPSAAKSISKETTFDQDVTDPQVIRQTFARLVADVGVRLRHSGLWAHKATLKIRFPDFTTMTRQQSFTTSVDDDDSIYRAVRKMWSSFNVQEAVRLVGVGVGDLHAMKQESLFESDRRVDRLSQAIDEVNRRLGDRALYRGREL